MLCTVNFKAKNIRMGAESMHDLPVEKAKKIMGILMKNTFYLELPLQERSRLVKYIFDL